MYERDRSLRNATYGLFVELGRPPTPAEVGDAEGLGTETVEQGWRRLHDAHALVLDRDGKILMANPFSAAPTQHRVEAGGRQWYANCAWDAFGICAALKTDGRITTACPDCEDEFALEVRNERPTDDTPLFHCLVPASRWWNDIAFT